MLLLPPKHTHWLSKTWTFSGSGRSVLALSLLLALKLTCALFLRSLLSSRSPPLALEEPPTYAYLASPHPLLLPLPHAPTSPLHVLMSIENTRHYELSTPPSDLEWAALTPSGGTFRLGSDRLPCTISMFHQLRCLDVVRREVVRMNVPGEEDVGVNAGEDGVLARHCLNYLRQMVVCRGDLALESLSGDPGEVHSDVATCKNWEVVYDELRRNQEEYASWTAAAGAGVRG